MENIDAVEKMSPKDPGNMTPLDGLISDDKIEAAAKDWKKRSPLGETYAELLEAEQVEE